MSKITINNEFYNGHKVLQKSKKTNSYRFHIEKLQEHYNGDFNNLNLEVGVLTFNPKKENLHIVDCVLIAKSSINNIKVLSA